MTLSKLPDKPKPNKVYETIDNIIDVVNTGGGGGGGTATDVQINGTSITSNNVANIVTNSAYNATSNKIATMADVPSDYLTNTATGSGALTIGGTASSNSAATNIGDLSEATANNSVALGYRAQATANFATAIGRTSKASGTCGIQIGYGTNSTANTLSIGFYNNSSTHYNWQLLNGTTGLIPDDRISSNIARTSQIPTIPTNISAFNNDSGYITGINSSDVTTALGYTPTSPANVDGQWVSKVEKIVDSISNTTGTNIYLDSNGTIGAGYNYLPNDNYKYEVMFLVRLGCTASKSSTVVSTFGSDILDMVSNFSDNMMACNKYSGRASVIATLPIGTSRYFKYSLTGSDSNTQFFTVYALGYRRIGTNS